MTAVTAEPDRSHRPPPTPIGALRPEDGYAVWQRAAATLARTAGPVFRVRRTITVALLATYTTDLLTELLPVAAAQHGLAVDLVKVPYGQIEQMLLEPRTSLAKVAPDYVLLGGTPWDLLPAPPRSTDPAGPGHADRPGDPVAGAARRWHALWPRIADLGAQPVQLGFVPPTVDPYGDLALRVPTAPSAVVHAVNDLLAERAGDRVLFVDLERVATRVGLDRWTDARYWHQLRVPFALHSLPWVATAIAGTLAADCGLTCRCVVVDLDNTLWWGVVGEDGIPGVQVGQGPRGEPYAEFQRYLRGLADRGVALAVASKNDRDLALRALTEVNGMVLSPRDFAHIVADWRPKSSQLTEIAATLRLGLDSLVFVDDNPAERTEVATTLPEVEVVDLPPHPARYAETVAAAPRMYPGRPSTANLARAASYRALADRATDLSEFLGGLEMRGAVRPVDASSVARAAELVAKTNQFNLTTRRRTQAELTAMLDAPDRYLAVLRLSDRFADHGIVGLVLVTADGTDAELDTVLLSCRVIGRTAERQLLAAAAAWASANGCERLVGSYRPTARNALVECLYPELGFTRTADRTDGGAEYVYHFSAGPLRPSPYIKEEHHAG